MSARGINQMSHSTDTIDRKTIEDKHNTGRIVADSSPRLTGICTFKPRKTSRFTPGSFLKNLANKAATALRSVPIRRRSSSTKVCASGRSKSFATPVDSHRTEAIEDCIEFINSSSSLQRSKSVSANPS